jgi:hypothetical protein
MRLSRRLVATLMVAGLAAVFSLAVHARSGTTTAWTRISGPAQPGIQLGLARSADGVLHVIWNRGATPTSIFETRLSPAGKVIGTSTVATGWSGNGGLALLVMPDKTLRLFAAGSVTPSSAASGINTLTAPSAGGKWTLQNGVYWGGAVANAAAQIGATLTRDGQPVTSWAGTAAVGVPPASIPQAYVADQTSTGLATDAATGAVVMSGVTIAGKGGIFVKKVVPGAGRSVTLPLPYGTNNWYSAVSGRIGAPGVYVAYVDTKALHLYRYGAKSRTLATGAYTSAGLCAGPGGRLWIVWGDQTDGLFVTRSNRAVSGFEPVQRLTGPGGSSEGLAYIQCEGSAGPLDLFADINVANGFWHTYVLPQFTLTARVAKSKSGAKVALSAHDAGDPVAGVAVVVSGKHVRTDAKGRATLSLPPGTYTATATAAGYAPATSKFTV